MIDRIIRRRARRGEERREERRGKERREAGTHARRSTPYSARSFIARASARFVIRPPTLIVAYIYFFTRGTLHHRSYSEDSWTSRHKNLSI